MSFCYIKTFIMRSKCNLESLYFIVSFQLFWSLNLISSKDISKIHTRQFIAASISFVDLSVHLARNKKQDWPLQSGFDYSLSNKVILKSKWTLFFLPDFFDCLSQAFYYKQMNPQPTYSAIWICLVDPSQVN